MENTAKYFDGNLDHHCGFLTNNFPVENWALDTAFADGGWRIFQYEINHNGSYYSDEDWEGINSDLLGNYINLEELTSQI